MQQYRDQLRGKQRDPSIKLLDPFSRDIFDSLDPILRQLYLADVVPLIISDPEGGADVLAALDEVSEEQTSYENDFLAAWLDVAVARGDFESLARLDELTKQKLHEVAGCNALLQGDLEQAEVCLGEIMPGGKRKSKLAAIGHLPSLLYLMLLFKNGSAEALGEARSIISSAMKARKGCYAGAIEVANAAFSFKQSPSSSKAFAEQLKGLCRSPLQTMLVGYFANWLMTEDDASLHVSNLVQNANGYAASRA